MDGADDVEDQIFQAVLERSKRDDARGEVEMRRKCPACTFENSRHLESCEVCASPLDDINLTPATPDVAPGSAFPPVQPGLPHSLSPRGRWPHSPPAAPAAATSPERGRDDPMSRPWRQLVHYIVQKRGSREVDGGRQAMGRFVREGAGINDISPKTHLSPLGFAVSTNQYKVVKALLDLKANLNQKMGKKRDKTVLDLAVENTKYDGTEMVRVLLSKEVDLNDTKEPNDNASMKYWFERARELRSGSAEAREHRRSMYEQAGAPRLQEVQFGIIGERPALAKMFDLVSSFIIDRASYQGKPLVILTLGPPGHGKTFLSRNVAKSLVANEEYYKEIAFGSIRDDADLFGSGGAFGHGAKDGELTNFLRRHQDKRSVIFMDEFEKIKDLTSALGWGQAKKMYTALLEPWQEGTLTDRGVRQTADGKSRIKCDKSIWILASNLTQDEIRDFFEQKQAHKQRLERGLTENDADWIQQELVEKIIRPKLRTVFSGVSKDTGDALLSRVNAIIPFLPFSQKELTVVADTELRNFFGEYRDEPEKRTPQNPEPRLIGDLIVHHTPSVVERVRGSYEVKSGARSIKNGARDALLKVQREYRSFALQEKADKVRVGKTEKHVVWVDYKKKDGFTVQYKKPEEGHAGGPSSAPESRSVPMRDSVAAMVDEEPPEDFDEI